MPALRVAVLVWVTAIGGQFAPSAEGVKPGNQPATAAPVVPMKIVRYAQRVVRQHDVDGDGLLQAREYQAMAGQPTRADADRDGVITPDEFARYVAEYADSHPLRLWTAAGQPALLASLFTPAEASGGGAAESPANKPASPGAAAKNPAAEVSQGAAQEAPEASAEARGHTKFYISPKRLPAGLPDWFLQRDQDGDGQLTLAEFAPKPTPAQLAEFARMDANRDGLVTARECQRAMGKKPKR